MNYPDLGDSNKKYAVGLTEPELNTIAAMIGYTRDGIRNAQGIVAMGLSGPLPSLVTEWLEHYGPTIELIEAKLAAIEEYEKAVTQ